MVFGKGNNKDEVKDTDLNKRKDGNEDDDDEDDPNTVDDEPAIPASELIGIHSSAISLDGRSLIVPDGGSDEDMSSLGTSRYTGGGHMYSPGMSVGYVGNMRVVGRVGKDASPGSTREGRRMGDQFNANGTSQKNGDYDFQENDYSVRTEEVHPPPQTEEKKTMDSDRAGKQCLPLWISTAPTWLKLIIIASTALLVGAVVLIGIGASLALDNSSASSTTALDQTNPGGNTVPTPAPVVAVLPTMPPNVELPPKTEEGQATTMSPTLSSSTAGPSSPPSKAAIESTSPPSIDTTLSPTTTVDESVVPSSVVTFFVIGGRFADLTMLSDGLQQLPSLDGDAVLFHLGDWNSPYTTSCVEGSYADHAEMFKLSQIPVYFTIGDNEYNGAFFLSHTG
jgi:hypothetical protein